MTVHADFTVSADNLTWIGPSQLVALVPGKRFRTPHHFYASTLLVMFRGLPVAAENPDGYTVIDDETFEMNEARTRPLDWFMVGYVKKEF